jgi:hypothetical protein
VQIANLIVLYASKVLLLKTKLNTTKKRDTNIQQHDNDKYGVTKDADIQ